MTNLFLLFVERLPLLSDEPAPLRDGDVLEVAAGVTVYDELCVWVEWSLHCTLIVYIRPLGSLILSAILFQSPTQHAARRIRALNFIG